MANINKYQIFGVVALTWSNDGLPMQGVAIPGTATATYNWDVSDGRDGSGNTDSRHTYNANITVNLTMALRNATANTMNAARPLFEPDAKVTLACSEDADFAGDYMVQPGVSKTYTTTGELAYNVTLIRFIDNSAVTILA